MSRMSVSASIEEKVLRILRGLCPDIPGVGFLEAAAAGEQKQEDPTAFQVRVYNLRQTKEASPFFMVSVDIRLNVEQAESANGSLFRTAHEAVAMWLERVMVQVDGEELDTDMAYVDGVQRTGDEKDFDTAGLGWFAAWALTLSGRVKQPEEQEQEAANG